MDNEVIYKVYKLVLTGGPCGGKTTGQARLSTFFENLGWKVFRVPETASILLSGGVKFVDLDQNEANKFQENLLLTMLKIEDTFFQLAESLKCNCLVICDRGAMDPSAFSKTEEWKQTLVKHGLNNVDLRDNRYDQIVHMVSAANGAEDFYSTESHSCRSEGVESARRLDRNAAGAWIGHPYVDVIDNSTDFEGKIRRMIAAVCKKLFIDTSDRLLPNSEKYKFLVEGPLPDDSVYESFQDFEVTHDYLKCEHPNQVRLRKRGQNDEFSYVHTVRKTASNNQVIEVRTQLSSRDYSNLLTLKDSSHFTVYKTRRCFLVNNQYFQFDIYQSPNHDKCKNLMLLETYSTLDLENLRKRLPTFLNVVKNVTKHSEYSMLNLSLTGNYKNYNSSIRSKDRYSGNDSKRGGGGESEKKESDSVMRFY